MVNRVSCDSTLEGSSEQQITSDAVIEVPFAFRVFPVGAIEATGTQVLDQILRLMLPRFFCLSSPKTIKHGLPETLQGNLLGLARSDSKSKWTLPGSEKSPIFFKCVLVNIEIPFAFRVFPVGAIEATGTQVLDQILRLMLPRFLSQGRKWNKKDYDSCNYVIRLYANMYIYTFHFLKYLPRINLDSFSALERLSSMGFWRHFKATSWDRRDLIVKQKIYLTWFRELMPPGDWSLANSRSF
ncbi:hypothetical protein F2Q68_00043324 [Brassica cretica]|uniref:Uncharacterized protein n=1 Tax=Brassica cretica TaxID=69181 RepID=A0A8S9LMP2_BRACR|nr:hypothetical protein F2Q68_00043324 [Brassica cretica]